MFIEYITTIPSNTKPIPLRPKLLTDKTPISLVCNVSSAACNAKKKKKNNWNFAKKDFTCTDASLKTFRLTFPIQKKSISVGSVNDPLEHEADSIASKVANGQNSARKEQREVLVRLQSSQELTKACA